MTPTALALFTRDGDDERGQQSVRALWIEMMCLGKLDLLSLISIQREFRLSKKSSAVP